VDFELGGLVELKIHILASQELKKVHEVNTVLEALLEIVNGDVATIEVGVHPVGEGLRGFRQQKFTYNISNINFNGAGGPDLALDALPLLLEPLLSSVTTRHWFSLSRYENGYLPLIASLKASWEQYRPLGGRWEANIAVTRTAKSAEGKKPPKLPLIGH